MDSTHIISGWSFASNQAKNIETYEISETNPCWFHCLRDHPDLKSWLDEQKVPAALIESLLTDDTRPRFEVYDENAFLIILRGINLNAGAEPDDMLSIRLLWYKGSLISTRKIPSKSVSSIIDLLERGKGPKSISELIVSIIQGINSYITHFLEPIEDQLNLLENSEAYSVSELSHVKSRLLRVRRYLKPQKYVLEDLLDVQLAQLEQQRFVLKNALDTAIRIHESIEFYLEYIDVYFSSQQQIQAERMNKNSYLLSIVAGVFLPAGFFTGLLGVNVAGIPGTENPFAFSLLCLALAVIIILEVILLRKLKFT